METWILNVIIIAVVAAIIAGITVYMIRAKKRGEKCIGCPYCKEGGKCGGGCSCGTRNE